MLPNQVGKGRLKCIPAIITAGSGTIYTIDIIHAGTVTESVDHLPCALAVPGFPPPIGQGNPHVLRIDVPHHVTSGIETVIRHRPRAFDEPPVYMIVGKYDGPRSARIEVATRISDQDLTAARPSVLSGTTGPEIDRDRVVDRITQDAGATSEAEATGFGGALVGYTAGHRRFGIQMIHVRVDVFRLTDLLESGHRVFAF